MIPTHFPENLLSYLLTNSETISNFVGSRSPGGSNSYIVNWLNDQANGPIHCPSGVIKAINWFNLFNSRK